MREHVALNGQIVALDDATISALDAGLMHAAGLFETMRAYKGRVVDFDAHMERMARSAEALHLQVALDRSAIARDIDALLAANVLADARIRLVLTPGPVPRDENPSPRPTTLITAGPVKPHPPELYQAGMRVCIAPFRQSRWDPLAGHKTLAYLPRLLAMKDAAQRRCNESLWFTTDHQLAEGSICNVFAVIDGRAATPPLSTPVLPGVVRQVVLNLCAALNIPHEERAIDIDALLSASEVFLTGSIMEVMPVTSIEKHPVGDGVPGPLTRRLAEAYRERLEKEYGPRG
jgi:branched-subunit amino acid aminotransferase/4-amino-4-deoxychorismate lyase